MKNILFTKLLSKMHYIISFSFNHNTVNQSFFLAKQKTIDKNVFIKAGNKNYFWTLKIKMGHGKSYVNYRRKGTYEKV